MSHCRNDVVSHESLAATASHERHLLPATALTKGPHYHFFGYYDKSPWDATGRRVLAGEVTFMDRPNTADDVLKIQVIDTADAGAVRTLDETTAWSWQQGAMLQWIPGNAERWIIYNQRHGDRLQSAMRDLHTGQTRLLPLPIYSLSPDGRTAVTLNFARLAHTRPGYGYPGLPDPGRGHSHPADDGVFIMDLNTGAHQLLVSLEQLARYQPVDSMSGAVHWVNHLEFSRDSRRLSFLHRWHPPERSRWDTRLMTVNIDGSDLYLLNPEPYTSHYDWRNDRELLAWAQRPDCERRYHLFTDRAPRAEVWGEGVLGYDGHCSFSPDGRWVLTDTYPIEGDRWLMLYEIATNRRIDIGRYFTPPQLTGEIRCDLHPRWRRDGKRICIDSAHEGGRQMYEVDVTRIVG